MTEAKRANEGKVDFTMLKRSFLEGVSRVLMMGAAKYGRFNWLGSLNTAKHDQWIQTCNESLARHYQAYIEGEQLDDESGLPHLAHMACNIMFIMEYQAKEIPEPGGLMAISPELLSELEENAPNVQEAYLRHFPDEGGVL